MTASKDDRRLLIQTGRKINILATISGILPKRLMGKVGERQEN